ncbi:hypothetical protein SDC9_191256 [bioreactor metagenome]|uniref:Uncharacterized protein n=1 Tax=bioreactor metagenome TaxID=1076179 RepID=A0A645HYP1_9ZZZZ
MTVQRTAFIATDCAQLSFHRHADGVAHLHHFAGLTDIFFVLQRGAIEHH